MELQCLHAEHNEALQNMKATKLKAKKCKRKGMSGILEEKMNHLAAKLGVDFEDLDSNDDPDPAKRIKEDPKSEFNLHREKEVPVEYFGMALYGIHRHHKIEKAYCNKIVCNEFFKLVKLYQPQEISQTSSSGGESASKVTEPQ